MKRPFNKYSPIPLGTEGRFILTPKVSKEYGLHIYQAVNHLEKRGKLLGIDLWIDVEVIGIGVLITWAPRNKEEEQN